MSAHGHEVVVQLLLEKNTDVHAQEGCMTVHSRLLAGGHEAVIWLLPDNYADVNMLEW